MATANLEATPQSLEDIHSSVAIPKSWWRRFLAFSGPAFLVSVGYMDPGNWGTDIEAGSKFGYRLLWVLLMSNLMAVLLQTLSARLGIVSGRDLAQTCRESYPKPVVFVLWVLCEIAIAACDLAEVIGTVIALKLLFGMPYIWGLAVAAADTFVLLALQRRGVRVVELVTLALVLIIGGSFLIEIVMAQPEWAAVVRGFIPGLDERMRESLYAAIGMLGATVMPHNLYLHSALVQTRAFPQTVEGKKIACKYNFIDSLVALNGAFFVNAAILILAVVTFFPRPAESDPLKLQEAHQLLGVWGPMAALLFAVALLASGQSSTLTGTLAGQVVMEGFVRIRLRPWVRRLLTRSIAILPALVVIALAGHEGLFPAEDGKSAVDGNLFQLLVLSQVVLSFQLPFAIVPLVQSTSDPRRMGVFANRGWLKVLAWICAGIVVSLNGVFIVLQMGDWAEAVVEKGGEAWWIYASVGPLALSLAGFLAWVAWYPLRHHAQDASLPTPLLPGVRYQNIGVAVELEGNDDAVLGQGAALAKAHDARLLLIHVVEGAGADIYGAQTADRESQSDRERITVLVDHLKADGVAVEGLLGFGTPVEELARIVKDKKLDLLVLGTHGHKLFADLALGSTVSPLLHRLSIPVLVVPAGGSATRPEDAVSSSASRPKQRSNKESSRS